MKEDSTRDDASFFVPRWELLEESVYADCRVFSVMRRRYRHPAKKTTGDFFVLDSSNWVNVIALTPEKQMVLVSQFRFGTHDLSIEIPGGMIDEGEDPLEGGVRELREETGFAGGRPRLIGSVHPNPAIQNNRCYFLLIEDARKVAETEWDHHEELAGGLVDVEEVFEMARTGEITHSLVLNALLFFQPHWEALRAGA